MGHLIPNVSAKTVFDTVQSLRILGAFQQRWVKQTQLYCDRLTPFTTQGQFPRILLTQPDSVEFLAGFMAACITNCPVFLGNPHWSIQEWQRVLELIQPHLVWGELPIAAQPQDPTLATAQEQGWMMIPTGGSSGQIRFAIHTWETLTASVQGFQSFFEVATVNSCCVLPLYHVSGLMQFLRSLLTHGQLQVIPFAHLLSGEGYEVEQSPVLERSSIAPQDFFLSLVPTQLQRLLQQPQRISWLQQFHTILLGGAPPWPTLLSQARAYQLNIAPTYGMTETAAQVVTLRPQDFLNGCDSAGTVLPHAQVEIVGATEQPLASHQIGGIVIKAKSLFQGYYPHRIKNTALKTDDLGYFDSQNYLYIQGRSSRKIISGGENIFPEEVEIALYQTGLVSDVYITGQPDPEWGEVVTALYVPQSSNVSDLQLKAALKSHLSPYKHPKHWLRLSAIPRNAQGKIDPMGVEQVLGLATTTKGDRNSSPHWHSEGCKSLL